MLAVDAVLQIDLGLPDQVVGAHQVPVVHRHRQHRLHGEGGLDVKRPEDGAWVKSVQRYFKELTLSNPVNVPKGKGIYTFIYSFFRLQLLFALT